MRLGTTHRSRHFSFEYRERHRHSWRPVHPETPAHTALASRPPACTSYGPERSGGREPLRPGVPASLGRREEAPLTRDMAPAGRAPGTGSRLRGFPSLHIHPPRHTGARTTAAGAPARAPLRPGVQPDLHPYTCSSAGATGLHFLCDSGSVGSGLRAPGPGRLGRRQQAG